jgi:hypothetical protein
VTYIILPVGKRGIGYGLRDVSKKVFRLKVYVVRHGSNDMYTSVFMHKHSQRMFHLVQSFSIYFVFPAENKVLE